MSALYAIGEALIDFIPQTKGVKLKEVKGFEPKVGGAPANVAACVAKLGGKSHLVSQLGNDAFGDLIIDTLERTGVDTRYISRTHEANTALAFVSLTHEGERDFSFYRNPSADMLKTSERLPEDITAHDIMHFSSVDLVPSPMKETHNVLIDNFHQANGLVIFEPNLRFPLWNDLNLLKDTVQAYLPKAHILKISDEELEFITGIKDVNEAIQSLFNGYTEAVIYTEGAKGATVYFKDKFTHVPGEVVTVQDTTGAGDAFIGAVIYQLLQTPIPIEHLKGNAHEILAFANKVGAFTTMGKGAIESLPTHSDLQLRFS
ncbi:carbohydrate kinase family protein [Macrococcoides caseolyticum]|uniref:carbohydrate kinase family protein n=1 Tax=Macrococcoides caseolyticum TaxID=69966 RepID=UPI001F46644E|nr:carbohydrate kinase [Macrococcus caseolyticus]MCE4958026.1 carbohydrate kinase [Macrococcus caseolyticus]